MIIEKKRFDLKRKLHLNSGDEIVATICDRETGEILTAKQKITKNYVIGTISFFDCENILNLNSLGVIIGKNNGN